MNRLLVLAMIVLGCRAEERTAAVARAPRHGLPRGKGRAVVVGSCTSCHSTHIIRQNRMSRAEWDRTITWMQDTQDMWKLPSVQRAKILDYLARHFGVEDEGDRVTPWAEPKYRPNPLW